MPKNSTIPITAKINLGLLFIIDCRNDELDSIEVGNLSARRIKIEEYVKMKAGWN